MSYDDGLTAEQEASLRELMETTDEGAFEGADMADMRSLWGAMDDALPADVSELTLSPPATIQQDLKAVKRAQRRLPIAIGILATFILGSTLSLGVRADSDAVLVQLGAVAFMLLGVLSLLAGVKLSGLKRAMGGGVLVACVAVFVGYTLTQIASIPTNADVAWYQIACLKATLMWAVPGVALIVWSLWGARMPTPLTGGLLGIGVGFFSATFLHLHCPVINPLHLLLHHGGGIALMGIAGAAIAWAILRRNLAQSA